MDLSTTYQVSGIAAALVAVLAGVVVWLRWARPRVDSAKTFFSRVDQTINGRPAEHDAYGREIAPAIPALSDQHRATQQALANLATTVADMHDERARIDDHERRISDLEHARVEKIVGTVETAAATIAARVQPDPGPGPAH